MASWHDYSSHLGHCVEIASPLEDLSVTQRGWTLDVLNIVRRLTDAKRQRTGALQDASRGSTVTGKRASVLECGSPLPLSPATDRLEFTNEEVYTYAHELEKLHPCRAEASAKTDRQPPHQRQNPPTTPSPPRRQIISSRRPRPLAPPLISYLRSSVSICGQKLGVLRALAVIPCPPACNPHRDGYCSSRWLDGNLLTNRHATLR